MSALPGASVPITLRQNRRIHHTVDGTQTFPGRARHSFACMCARGYIHGDITSTYRRGQRVQARAPAPGYIPGRLQGRPCGGISRDTDATSRVTRCLDTFRNMRKKISFFLAISFRMSGRRDTCSPFSRRIKNVPVPFRINDTSLRIRFDSTTFALLSVRR